MYIQAAEFKAKCLKLMDTVQKYGEEIIITKHGKPIAKLVAMKLPEKEKDDSWFGCMKGTGKIVGDIVGPTGEKWNAEEE